MSSKSKFKGRRQKLIDRVANGETLATVAKDLGYADNYIEQLYNDPEVMRAMEVDEVDEKAEADEKAEVGVVVEDKSLEVEDLVVDGGVAPPTPRKRNHMATPEDEIDNADEIDEMEYDKL